MSFRNCQTRRAALSPVEAEREWFARLLWKAFPEATSEEQVADLAAQVLSGTGRAVTPRAVRNWLRCENTPHFRYVLPLLAMAGTEALFGFFDPELRR